jgi:hypothetical protein
MKIYPVKDKKLAGLTDNYIPQHFLFFDTETKQSEDGIIESHEFDMAWTCYWNSQYKGEKDEYVYYYWENPDEMCNYMHRRVQETGKLIILGHNVYFDLQVCGFFKYFSDKGYKLSFIYDQASSFILKVRLGGKDVICLSTTNWFDQPLRDLGEIVGLKKLDVDFKKSTREEIKVYCRRDVEILTKIIGYYIDFIKEHNLGKFSYTKASQAFTAYRYRFMTEKIRIHSNSEVVELERYAYMGGRTEAFYIGECKGGPFQTLDINSMYPYVMTMYEYPRHLVDYRSKATTQQLKKLLERFLCIAEIELTTEIPAYAYRYNKKTVFPVGTFKTVLSTEGLKLALSRNEINKIYRISIYEKGNLFNEYVNYFHKLRYKYKDENNNIMVLLCKYFENSLYGKFGQKYSIEKKFENTNNHDYYREEIWDATNKRNVIRTWIMNTLVEKYGEKEGKYSFVAVAAHVTENARLLLWNIIDSIGKERVLYCDTDSIKIRTSDLKYLNYPIEPGVLGALKVEDQTNELFIGGSKFYITEHNRKIKGIPRTAEEIEPGIFEFYIWPKMTYHLRQGVIAGYDRKKIRRRININYDKGIVMKNGKVNPHRF